MDTTFDYGDMVLVVNTRSPYWNHCGTVQDFEFDNETGITAYTVDMGSGNIGKFSTSELELDIEGSEITEIVE